MVQYHAGPQAASWRADSRRPSPHTQLPPVGRGPELGNCSLAHSRFEGGGSA